MLVNKTEYICPDKCTQKGKEKSPSTAEGIN